VFFGFLLTYACSSFHSQTNESSPDDDKALVLPDVVRQKLDELGINGDVQVQAEADLDTQGRWGHRFLVATPQRLVVLSAPDLPQDRAIDTVTSKIVNGSKSAAIVTVDLDVPLQDIISTEAKTLVGAASLEARVRNLPSSLSGASSLSTASSNGTATNGAATNGAASNGVLLNGNSANGAAGNGAGLTAARRVLVTVMALNTERCAEFAGCVD
jgi:hypothetical protein